MKSIVILPTLIFIATPAFALAQERPFEDPLPGPVDAPPSEPSETSETGDVKESLRSTIDEVSTKKFLHGFRLGYLYVLNTDTPVDGVEGSPSLAEKYGIRSPHQFLIGYEAAWRMVGHDWLNVLLVGNVMVSGLEQSRIFPSGNMLIGFEAVESLQLGVGVNLMPMREKPAHMVLAAGWTPRVGDIYTPIHAFFVPDVDGQHRLGLTIGVNW